MASLLLRNVVVAAKMSACFLDFSTAPRSFFSSWILGCSQLVRSLQALTTTQLCGTDVLPFLPSSPHPNLQHIAGFKSKVILRRRCKDCFFVRRRGRLYVYCKTHPRHKQRKI